jgi:hypothetical protein
VPVEVQGVQAWDRYAYVNNSPARFNDPSGRMLSDPRDDGCAKCKEKPENGTTISAADQPISNNNANDAINKIGQKVDFWWNVLQHTTQVEEGLDWVINYGRPSWRHVRGIHSFMGPVVEGGVGALLQFAHDSKNPTLTPYQRVGRSLTIGLEDAATDSVSTTMGIITGGALGTAGGAATSPTGPGALAGTGLGGFVGYVGGSYLTTQACDIVFEGFNLMALPFWFPYYEGN